KRARRRGSTRARASPGRTSCACAPRPAPGCPRLARPLLGEGFEPAVVAGIEQVRDGEPEAPRVAEESERENHHQSAPEYKLLRERRTVAVEQKKPRHRDQDSHGVIDVDRADEEALLALESEPAEGAFRVHAEESLEHLPHAAARAAKSQRRRNGRQKARA